MPPDSVARENALVEQFAVRGQAYQVEVRGVGLAVD